MLPTSWELPGLLYKHHMTNGRLRRSERFVSKGCCLGNGNRALSFGRACHLLCCHGRCRAAQHEYEYRSEPQASVPAW